MIRRVKDSDKVPMVLIGSKGDLEKHRLVSVEQAEGIFFFFV